MDVVVRLCDWCIEANKRAQALQRSTTEYTLTEGDRTAKLVLCSEHGERFESVLPGKPGRKPVNDPGPELILRSAPKKVEVGIGSVLLDAAPAKKAAAKRPAKKAAAKKAPAKKAAAKKAAPAGRRGRRITTPEEIEASKNGG